MSIYNYKAGIGNSASYQVSGKPWCSGSIDLTAVTTPYKIGFPSVTKWVEIRNLAVTDGQLVICAFSENGLPSKGGTNHFTLLDLVRSAGGHIASATKLDVKITELWIEGTSVKLDVLAGLTGIDTNQILNNWSGSAGIG
tara:strand:+ start:74713 stop:75132 length:420 start_codon:yes stop_codon:yes gene_type:complete